jgi:hypothetical protein
VGFCDGLGDQLASLFLVLESWQKLASILA